MEIEGSGLVAVLQFLDIPTLLQAANIVSRLWAESVDSRELWSSLLSHLTGSEYIIDVDQVFPGRHFYKSYHTIRRTLFLFEENRIAEDLLKQKPGYTRQPCRLGVVSVPSGRTSYFTLDKDYIHAFHSSYLWLPPNRLFITGGRYVEKDRDQTTSPTYLLSLRDFTSTRLLDTAQINTPALCRAESHIYSFGGSVFPPSLPAEAQKTCRRFCLRAWQWESLPDMPNCHCFAPVQNYNSKIYVLGGLGSQGSIDELNLTSLSFRTLTLLLPSLNDAIIAAYKSEFLYCLSSKHVFTVSLEGLGEEGGVQDKGAPAVENVWMGSGVVVVEKDKAYFTVFEKVVFAMTLVNFSLELIRKGEA